MRPTDAALLSPREPSPADAGAPQRRYDAFRARRGAVHLLPRDGGATGMAAHITARLRWRSSPSDAVTVASRGSLLPEAVEAACPGATVRRVTFDPDPRRRAAFVVAGPHAHEHIVVKVTRSPGEATRGSVEQERLSTVAAHGLGLGVPRPLGHGDIGDVAWSAESLARGVPMSRASTRWRRRHGAAVLDRLAGWLVDLGAVTSHACADRPDGERLPLRGMARERLGDAVARAGALPSVLTHGDLASGENVLVDRRSFVVIDWETAVDDGVPLVDLLPTLALGLAAIHGGRAPAEQASYALRLCRGEAAESPWLFEHIDAYLERLGIARDRAGDLALLAWGYQASMRARHDELVRASGQEPMAWISPAELVLDAWIDDDDLGTRWRPFLRARA